MAAAFASNAYRLGKRSLESRGRLPQLCFGQMKSPRHESCWAQLEWGAFRPNLFVQGSFRCHVAQGSSRISQGDESQARALPYTVNTCTD